MGSFFSRKDDPTTQHKEDGQRMQRVDPEFYQLIDSNGSGELIFLTKQALKLNNNSILNRYIKEKVEPHLYNKGLGEHV